MDRGYVDFKRLYMLHTSGGCFVIRSKKNLQFYRKSSTRVDRSKGLSCDQIIRLTRPKPKKNYTITSSACSPGLSRHNQNIILLTNIKTCSAETIREYYKSRWSRNCGKLFFKWFKAAIKNQGVHWTIAKCCENPNLDSHLQLFNHTNYSKNESF